MANVKSNEKITWSELDDFLRANPERKGVVVFKQHPSWDRQYSELERSYWLDGKDNHFQPGKISNSIWGFCLDTKSPDADGIRLDWVIYGLPDERWDVDYCYILPEGK